MTKNQLAQSEQIDKLLNALADPYCRSTLAYLQEASNSVVSVQDLANELNKDDHGGTTQVSIELHHSTLPRLADVDAVEYDSNTHTVRYHGHPQLETLLDSISGSFSETRD